jgi:hypothetical protein
MTEIDIEALQVDAIDAAGGLRDFGDPAYRSGLDVLVRAAATSPMAGQRLSGQVARIATSALVGRLWSESGWRAHPGFEDQPITAPLIVIGLPRSGTTALHQLLATEGQFLWIPAWLAGRPGPRPIPADWAADARFQQAMARRAADGPNPLHDVGPGDPQECLNVMVQSFVSMMFVSTLPVPDYHQWFLAQDERPSYRRYADNLRLIGGGDRRRWLLKNPSHVFALGALLDVFPDARIIWIHRDPAASIPSGCGLIMSTAGADGELDPVALGRHRLRIWSMAATRAELARQSHPDAQIHDVDYRQFVSDPQREVRAIYDRFGLDLMPDPQTSMTSWLAENPQGRHGVHRYSPEQYGLTRGKIHGAFGHYIDRYQLTTQELGS